MSTLLSSITPWMETVVFEALLGTSTPVAQGYRVHAKIVQVLSFSTVELLLHYPPAMHAAGYARAPPRRVRGWRYQLSDGQTHMMAVAIQREEEEETGNSRRRNDPPITRGCVARIRDWHACPLSVVLPPSARTEASSDVVGLFLGEPLVVVGGAMAIVGPPQPVHETVQVRRALQSLVGTPSWQERVKERMIRPGSRLEHLICFDSQPPRSENGANLPIGNVEALFADPRYETTLDALWKTKARHSTPQQQQSRNNQQREGFRIEPLQGGTSHVVANAEQMQDLFDGVVQAAATATTASHPPQQQQRPQPSGQHKPAPAPPTQPPSQQHPPREQQRLKEEFLEDGDEDEDEDEEEQDMGISNMLMSQEDEDAEQVPMESQQQAEPPSEAAAMDRSEDYIEESESQGLETQLPSVAPTASASPFLPCNGTARGSTATASQSSNRKQQSASPSSLAALARTADYDAEVETQEDTLETQPVLAAPALNDTSASNRMEEATGGRETFTADDSRKRIRTSLPQEDDDEVVNMELVRLRVCAPRQKGQPMSSMEELWRTMHKPRDETGSSPSENKDPLARGLAGDSLRALFESRSDRC